MLNGEKWKQCNPSKRILSGIAVLIHWNEDHKGAAFACGDFLESRTVVPNCFFTPGPSF